MDSGFSTNRRYLAGVAVSVVLAMLFAREFHHWQDLQWGLFSRQIGRLKWPNIAVATLLFYLSFVVRAWRWKLFLKPVRRTTTIRVLGPTFIGFMAGALFGGAGELSRPWLIARKEDLTISSQMAVWMVERIFDIAGFTLLLLLAVFFVDVRSVPYLEQFRRLGLLLFAIVAVSGVMMIQVERHGAHLERIVERMLTRIMPRIARKVAEKLGAISAGLNTFSDVKTFFQQSVLSVLMWAVIALAYHEVLRAFPPPLETMPLAYAPLVLAFAIFGGLVQLPGGATSQLVVIAALLNVFHVPGELAVGCGIALWLGAYGAPVPIGLIYLRHEHLSMSMLSRQGRALRTNEPRAQEDSKQGVSELGIHPVKKAASRA